MRRFCKPLDTHLVERLAAEHEVLITLEEGAIGGFGAHVLHFMANRGLLDKGCTVRSMVLKDIFVDQDKPDKMYEIAGLNSANIVKTAFSALGKDTDVEILSPQRA